MRCKEIEDHVISLGLDPINVRFKKGQEVLWFVSVNRHDISHYDDVVVHDDQGRAFVCFGCIDTERVERCDYTISGHLEGTAGSEYVKMGGFTCVRWPEYDVPGKEGT